MVPGRASRDYQGESLESGRCVEVGNIFDVLRTYHIQECSMALVSYMVLV